MLISESSILDRLPLTGRLREIPVLVVDGERPCKNCGYPFTPRDTETVCEDCVNDFTHQ